MKKFDVLIVGAGLSGSVLAERLASKKKKRVLLIEKRNHIGGNCYDFIDENNILMNKYGIHIFHTNDERVWKYVQKFSKWIRWDHRVLSNVDEKLVNIPVNINTVNKLFDKNISNKSEMDKWLDSVQVKYKNIKNSEEMAKSMVGKILYNKLFKYYTFKQWGRYPEELDPSVLARIPVRNNWDDRYFTDKYQALPKLGYTNFIKNILSHKNIEVRLNTDFFDVKEKIDYDLLIYTGPIDKYFGNEELEKLEYRSIEFIEERYKNTAFYQTNSQINYPSKDVPFTRIVEYKHLLNQKSKHTTIVKEITKDKGEPYYPVPNKKNLDLYEKYKKLAVLEKNVLFVGRLASYKYFNMDQAIKSALDMYNNLENARNN